MDTASSFWDVPIFAAFLFAGPLLPEKWRQLKSFQFPRRGRSLIDSERQVHRQRRWFENHRLQRQIALVRIVQIPLHVLYSQPAALRTGVFENGETAKGREQ